MTEPSRPAPSPSARVELRFLEGVSRRLPDDPQVLKPLGDLYTGVGRYREGLAVDRRLVSLCPDDAEVWYNLGCSLARVGESDEAFLSLGRAIDYGYEDADWMGEDEDLQTLRADPRFARLIARVRTGG